MRNNASMNVEIIMNENEYGGEYFPHICSINENEDQLTPASRKQLPFSFCVSIFLTI